MVRDGPEWGWGRGKKQGFGCARETGFCRADLAAECPLLPIPDVGLLAWRLSAAPRRMAPCTVAGGLRHDPLAQARFA